MGVGKACSRKQVALNQFISGKSRNQLPRIKFGFQYIVLIQRLILSFTCILASPKISIVPRIMSRETLFQKFFFQIYICKKKRNKLLCQSLQYQDASFSRFCYPFLYCKKVLFSEIQNSAKKNDYFLLQDTTILYESVML